MTPLTIQILRYGVLPLGGLIAGCGVACWRAQHATASDRMNGSGARWLLLVLMAVSLATMGWMVTARYTSWHSFVFDLGSYDQKVWLVAQASSLREMWELTYKGGLQPSPCGINWYWGICHFQPWLLILGFVYKAWDSPLVLLWLQVLLVVSGVVPVFLLVRDRFTSPTAGVLASALYLLYPAVQYNGVVDYRPDHMAIPTTLWAYLLAARGQYVASLGMVGLAGLAKETLILNAAFFGLYLAVRHRQRVLGGIAFIGGLIAFYAVLFHLLRFTTVSEGEFMLHRYYPELSAAAFGGISEVVRHLGHIMSRVAETHKLLYLMVLFAPLALLPVLALPEFIPAIPSLAMSLLSTNPNMVSVESQYSASIVAPAFAALIAAVARLRDATGKCPIVLPAMIEAGPRARARQAIPRLPGLTSEATPVPVFTGLLVLNLIVSIGLSPSVLSLNFWDSRWGGRWQEAQYRHERQAILNQAMLLIPTDPKVKVVTQNDVNSGRLAHRYNFFAFPYAIERADYILLDTAREPYVHWSWSPERYQALVTRLRADPAFTTIFERDGVLVLKRRQAFHADLGVMSPDQN